MYKCNFWDIFVVLDGSCPKIPAANRRWVKHMSKSKCTKRTNIGPLLQVDMSKKCRPLWREAHVEAKSEKKTEGYRALLDVQMSFFVAGAGDCAPCQKWAKRGGFCSSFNYNHHYTRLHSTPLHYIRLQLQLQLQLQRHYITLHYSTLITLHYAVHYAALNYPTLHSTPLNRTTTTTTATTSLHCTILHLTNYIALRYTTLRYTTLHYTPLHCTTLHSITPQ